MASTASSSDTASVATSPNSSPNSTPSSSVAGHTEKAPDESSKLRIFLSILKKFIGVADISAIRFSLPAQLLEPTPNLEYWNYLDQPNTFIAIGDSDEPLDRMLEVLRFWFTKDLKYVKGKPCKPYNSTLGEFFRCNWEIEDTAPYIDTAGKLQSSAPQSSASSMKSAKNSQPTSQQSASTSKSGKPVRVSFLTEQTSHHPPVSAFYIDCPEKGISARGFDQLAAKFTGTSIKVTPGEHNLGIFINIQRRNNEEYQLTHPAAHLGGFFRGNLSVSVGDSCYVTCPQTKLKTILQYVEDGWLGKAQNRVEGVIFRYDPNNDNKTRIKDVPEKDVLVRISGNWREQVSFTLPPKFDKPHVIVDLRPLEVAPKLLPPASSQLPNESLRYWSGVTEAIHARQFNRATELKQEIEQRQRDRAKEREESGTKWQPRFFVGAVTPLGKPALTEEGKEVLKNMQELKWELKESTVLGA